MARFPWLSANIEYNVTKEPYFSTPYCIKHFGDLKIAIVGVTADELMESRLSEMEQDVSIEKTFHWHQNDGLDISMKLKSQIFLIVIYHGGSIEFGLIVRKIKRQVRMKLKN